MTTAREALAKQLHELMKGNSTPEAQNKLLQLLDDFRVQAKPGTEVQQGLTARESLGKAIVVLWKRGPKDLERSVDTLLDKYRMQVKKEGAVEPGAKPAAPPPATRPAIAPAAAKPASASSAAPSARTGTTPVSTPRPASATTPGKGTPTPAAAKSSPKTPASTKTPAAEPPRRPGNITLPPPRAGGLVQSQMAPRAAPQSVTPLFPNTPTGPSKRAECPKCKGRGVVLARSYTQEEYYTCIYCGWQAFKPFEEANADSPLAARLLAQRPAVPDPAAGKDKGDDEGRKSKSVIRDDDEGDSMWSRSVMSDDASRGPTVRPDDGEEEAPRRAAVAADEEEAEGAEEDEDFDLDAGAGGADDEE